MGMTSLVRVLALVWWLCLVSAGISQAQVPAAQSFPNLTLELDGNVFAVTQQVDGGIIIGGDFTHVNGVSRYGIARIQSNGSVDPIWDPRAFGVVYALAVGADGSVYVGGLFSKVGAHFRENLAKVSGESSGALDPQWNPGTNGEVYSLAVDSKGRVYAGGQFTSVGGYSRDYIVRLSADGAGAVDPVWDPSASFVVTKLAVNDGDDVFAAGWFEHIGGQPRKLIAKLSGSGDGAAEPGWNPQLTGMAVLSLDMDSAGAIYVSGHFCAEQGTLTQCGAAKLSGEGSGGIDSLWNPVFNDSVSSLAVSEGDVVYVSGSFSAVNGYAAPGVARLTGPAGELDQDWDFPSSDFIWLFPGLPGGSVHAAGLLELDGGLRRSGVARIDHGGVVSRISSVGTAGSVGALLAQSDGGLIVGGSFRYVNGLPRENIFRLRPGGSLDPEWHVSADKRVDALAADSSGSVFVGGDFQQIGGQPRSRIAKLTGAGVADVDAEWNPTADGLVQALIVSEDGSVYAAGYFGNIGAQGRVGLAKLDGNGVGAVDPLWNPGVSGIVNAMTLSAGALYVGGSFVQVGGLSRSNMAKVSAEGLGTVDPAWNPSLNGAVYAVALDEDGSVIVGGAFTSIGGTPRNYIARLAGGGAGLLDPGWNPWANAHVFALAMSGDGSVLAGGTFTYVGGLPRARLAKIHSTGSGHADQEWNPGISGQVSVLTRAQGDAVYVGGRFTYAGNLRRDGLARLLDDPDIVFQADMDGW